MAICWTSFGIADRFLLLEATSTNHNHCDNRYDWSPHRFLFVVRKPTPVHARFTASIVHEIWSQLENFSRGDKEVAVILDRIWSKGCSDVKLRGLGSIDCVYPMKSPDASFCHSGTQYSSVIIETSCPQTKKVG